jgi:hypothetical protein
MPDRLPSGEIRRDTDGTVAVCLGSDRDLRWKVVGFDPRDIDMHGWRADRHVRDWAVLGNVHDLVPAESVAVQRFEDVALPFEGGQS